MRLSHKEIEAVDRAISELHACHDLQTFRLAVPRIFLRLVPGDYFVLTDYQLRSSDRNVKLLDYFESDQRFSRESISFAENHLFEHPFTKYFLGGSAPTALKQTDFQTGSQSRHSAWGDALHRYTAIDHLISLPLMSGVGNATAMNIGRRRRDFNERDRLVLNLVRPHYDQACWNIKWLTGGFSSGTISRSARCLTPREAEVACWLGEGKSNQEIALILGAATRTVEKHMERILEKLHVENRATAAVTVARCRALPPSGVASQVPLFLVRDFPQLR